MGLLCHEPIPASCSPLCMCVDWISLCMCVDWIPSACVWTGSPLHVCGLDPLHMCVDWIALCMCVDWIPSACVRSATNDLTNQ